MRTTDAGQDAEIIKTHVAPFHIVKMVFANTTSYVSEGPDILFGGFNYVGGGIEVGAIYYDQTGFKSADLKLLNYNGSAIAIALQNKIADVPCSIWLVYRTGVATFTNPIFICSGVLDPQSIDDDSVSLKVVPPNVQFELLPQVYCNKESGFLNLIKNGTVISWGDEKFELKN